ncbi:hypothetical protein [Paraburkholderia sp. DGU8]|uniref:hypothetical protein n=1 Tax=Paraburkholderia sp. DGU8 TaxID=3161997 RepID=UPI0034650262
MANGNYMVVYHTNARQGANSNYYDLVEQQYTANGIAVGGPVTLASSVQRGAAPSGDYQFGYYNEYGHNQDDQLTAALANPDGSFETFSVVNNASGTAGTAVLQFYNSAGQQTTGVAIAPSAGTVAPGTAGNTLAEGLIRLGNGDLVATYAHGYTNNFGIGYQAFTSTGALVGSGTTLVANSGSNADSGYMYYGNITNHISGAASTSASGLTASLVGGNEASGSQFAVAYSSNLSGGTASGTAGTYFHSYLQLADETGGAVGAPINVSTLTGSLDSISPSVAALKEGGVVVVWASDSLNANGTAATSAQMANFHLYAQIFNWNSATSSWAPTFNTEQRVDTAFCLYHRFIFRAGSRKRRACFAAFGPDVQSVSSNACSGGGFRLRFTTQLE